ncbi:hypothetical protein M501DRAFT_1012408 [Patellaria atrata CBS 101060]|uniref:Uncharacterized protein n=1 Tax=Patellaria atrata CBS 101060 TaxID=1346257 RepID=A0A9P4SHI2_9PEZI|nr:hypothetical protein M501DRAFT_1012408 [Patellaria atrata CBS 101060]
MNFIGNLIQPTVDNVVQSATAAAGSFAGDLVIGAGDLISSTGQGIGNNITTVVDGWGRRITKVGDSYITPSGQVTKQLPGPSTSRASAVVKSNSPQRSLSYPNQKFITAGNKTTPGPIKPLGQKTGAVKAASTTAKVLPYVPPVKDTPGKSGEKQAVGKTTGAQSKPYAGTSITPKTTSSQQKPYPGSSGASKTSVPSNASKPSAGQAKPYSSISSDNKPPTSKMNQGISSTKNSKPYAGSTAGKGKENGENAYPGTTTLPSQARKQPVNTKWVNPKTGNVKSTK